MIRIGVIGYGYWGPNVVRNFNSAEGARVTAICDRDPELLKKAAKNFPGVKKVSNSDDITTSPDIDAVAIVTPVTTHYALARKALENGKHVFVEKPFTTTIKDAVTLIELAEKKRLKIMVDHTFLFTGAVKKIKQLIDDEVLGKIFYFDSVRVNLGLFQHDINVVWDLAPHDFAIMNYVIKEKPVSVSTFAKSHINHQEDIAYIAVNFGSNIIAHFSVNWISPMKIRSVLIGGEKKMLVWNDINSDEKIKVYDKGAEIRTRQGMHDLLVNYRSGDVFAPQIGQSEALKLECENFVTCVENDCTAINDGHAGLEVVRMLEACDRSIKNNGKTVKLNYA